MKGSPGGILFIGVGVFLLYLGWSGKIADIINAVKGGASQVLPGGTTEGHEPGDQGALCSKDSDCHGGQVCMNGVCGLPTDQRVNCRPGERRLRIQTQGSDQLKCVSETRLAAQENGTCRPGYILTHEIIDQSKPDDMSKPVCMQLITGAGEAGSFSIVPLPTGFFGQRYQPNVR